MSEGMPTDTSEPFLDRQFAARIVHGNVEFLTPAPVFDCADDAWNSTAFRARHKTPAGAPDPILLYRRRIVAVPRDRARKFALASRFWFGSFCRSRCRASPSAPRVNLGLISANAILQPLGASIRHTFHVHRLLRPVALAATIAILCLTSAASESSGWRRAVQAVIRHRARQW